MSIYMPRTVYSRTTIVLLVYVRVKVTYKGKRLKYLRSFTPDAYLRTYVVAITSGAQRRQKEIAGC